MPLWVWDAMTLGKPTRGAPVLRGIGQRAARVGAGVYYLLNWLDGTPLRQEPGWGLLGPWTACWGSDLVKDLKMPMVKVPLDPHPRGRLTDKRAPDRLPH